MKVYKVGPDLACGKLTQVCGEENDDADWEKRYEAAGKPSAAGWHPPRLESPRGKAKVLPVDCVGSTVISAGDMLLNERAREALALLLLPCGEYLPVQVDGLDYQCFNCTTLVDVADQNLMEGERSTESSVLPGWWDRITRWAFHPKRVATAPVIFTVPQRRRMLMCTDVLRQAVEEHDLLGFQFDLLWSPEDGGIEINNSPAQFFGESGRQMNIAGKERRKAMLARLAARSVKPAGPAQGTVSPAQS